MIVAFDLDDTLYVELDYVKSGFRAVADYLHNSFGVSAEGSYDVMLKSLAESGRGRQFDTVLRFHNLYSARRRDLLIQVYRQHQPAIELPESSQRALLRCQALGHQMFLVTDGNHRVQARKIDALGLWTSFEHCYLTNRYGRASAKPSTRVFELMLRRANAKPPELVYIADDPAKDFIGIRGLGGSSIRVLTGNHAAVDARPGYDADLKVPSVEAAVDVLSSLA